MQRSIKVSLKVATATKQRRLATLLREVRSCTQRYIDYLWAKPGRLDAVTLNQVAGGSLSYRHRSNCLKVALETISSTRKAAKATGVEASCPQVNGAVRLSSLVAKVEPGKGVFNYVLKVSGPQTFLARCSTLVSDITPKEFILELIHSRPGKQ